MNHLPTVILQSPQGTAAGVADHGSPGQFGVVEDLTQVGGQLSDPEILGFHTKRFLCRQAPQHLFQAKLAARRPYLNKFLVNKKSEQLPAAPGGGYKQPFFQGNQVGLKLQGDA